MTKILISILTPTIRPHGLGILQESLERQTFGSFEWLVEIGVPGKGHDLNAAYNRMLRRARGELVVSMQDFIKAPQDYLQKFWDAYQKDKNIFYTAPVGKVDNLNYTGPIKWDWRAQQGTNPDWKCWEIDSACAPLSVLKEIGGFDEEMDGHWSCDNLNVMFRADMVGHKVANLFTNPVLVYDHDAHIPHPFRKDFDPDFNRQRMALFELGLKLPPL